MILIIVIIVVLVLLVLFFMSSYNKLVRLSNRVDEGFSTMDVYLKKRFDLIPNLVETVKGYAWGGYIEFSDCTKKYGKNI